MLCVAVVRLGELRRVVFEAAGLVAKVPSDTDSFFRPAHPVAARLNDTAIHVREVAAVNWSSNRRL